MRILLADSDRDMLSVYRRLMEMAGHTAETAFDGIQVLKLLGAAPFDLAVINERLPRIAHERILSALRNQGTPALVLLDRPLHVSRLCGEELANAYLTFPFFPAELSALALDVTRKATPLSGWLFVPSTNFRIISVPSLRFSKVTLLTAPERSKTVCKSEPFQ